MTKAVAGAINATGPAIRLAARQPITAKQPAVRPATASAARLTEAIITLVVRLAAAGAAGSDGAIRITKASS
jgi:hypothetical protein